MRFGPTSSDEGLSPALYPAMIAVVFLLVSFFVLGIRFPAPERDLPIGYGRLDPTPSAAGRDFPSVIPIQLKRSEAGVAIRVGPVKMPDNDFRAIRTKLAEINMPEIDVLVLADPSLSVDQVAQALDEVLASPMKRVSVASLAAPKSPAAATRAGKG